MDAFPEAAVGTEVTILERGAPVATARRCRRAGVTAWRISGPDVAAFDLEPHGRTGRRWFATRPDGAPFAAIDLAPGLPERLELSDGRGLHLAVTNGAVTTPEGRVLGRVVRRGPATTELRLRRRLDPRLHALLVAAAVLRLGA